MINKIYYQQIVENNRLFSCIYDFINRTENRTYENLIQSFIQVYRILIYEFAQRILPSKL